MSGSPFECRFHGAAFTYGCPGCEAAEEDTCDAALVRSRLRWWRLNNLCGRLGHFYRELEPEVYRCRVCRTLLFAQATEEQLHKWLLGAADTPHPDRPHSERGGRA